jgi:enamine deaminase RidA (YjgF/YER057c/UK114 family)
VGQIEERLNELGITLPHPFTPPPDMKLPFDWVRVSGNYAYVSGHGPLDGSDVLVIGKVGSDVTPERGYEAARLTGLAILSSLREALGDLDRITGWAKALGLVNCAPGFNGTPGVINGFSDLVFEVWGDRGRHARSAIGAAELPFDMSVEIEAIVEIDS